MKHAIAVTAIAMSLAGGLGAVEAKSISQKAEADQVIDMSSSDPAMQKAFASAKKTLPDFLQKAAKPAPGTEDYMLKVALTDGRNTEYFWMVDFKGSGNQYEATLANTPALVRGYRGGQRVSFKAAQIVDWMYMEPAKNRMHGNFTACALLSKEPPKEAEAFKKQYGLNCAE